jgi:hypothetical protein
LQGSSRLCNGGGHGTPSDRSDTPSDRPGEPGTDTEPRDAGTDRVVSLQEAGLGGGLDQAEEAQRGKTDEQIARERGLEAELIKTPPPRKK